MFDGAAGIPSCNFTRAGQSGQSFECSAPNYEKKIVEEPTGISKLNKYVTVGF